MTKSSAKLRSQKGKPRSHGLSKIGWNQPLTILVITTLIGVAGWAGQSIFFNHGSIRVNLNDTTQLTKKSPSQKPAETVSNNNSPTGTSGAFAQQGNQNTLHVAATSNVAIKGVPSTRPPLISISDPQQAISLASSTIPYIGSKRLYCDTLKTTLVINYGDFGSHAVAITRIAMNAEPVIGVSVAPCRIDPLSSQPKGITLRDSYIFTLRDSGNVGKYIHSGNVGAASDVSFDNILETNKGTQVIFLKPSEKPIVRDVYVNSLASIPQKVWFTVYYNSGGEESINTSPLYISSSQ